jgi:hypothetical protein
MKKTSLTIFVVLFILSFSNKLQAQTAQIKLNQVELMKQFAGTWKGEVGKDTIVLGDNVQFGYGLECKIQIQTNGNVLDEARQLFGYDKKSDKFIIAELIKSSPVIEVLAMWFTSEKSGEMVRFQDISDPESAVLKWKFEFRSPDIIVQTALVDGKVIKTVTTTRVVK